MSLPAHHYDDNHCPLLVSHRPPSLRPRILLRLVLGTKIHRTDYYVKPDGNVYSSAKAKYFILQ